MKISFYKYKKILITGGAGFIGSNLIIKLLKETCLEIYNIDKLGYASNHFGIENCLSSLGPSAFKRYQLIKTDLRNQPKINEAIVKINPDLVLHLAAESHVDKSIKDPEIFLRSNIEGTFNLLNCCLDHYIQLSKDRKKEFRFLHVSTDEVFGSLSDKGSFSESSKYDPRSPYSATKAASDHLVKAWFHTYNLPVIISNCGNNFGPWQFEEKLIPKIIKKAISNEVIPIYGDGLNIRDWIYVDDHINALLLILLNGEAGQSYCIGSNNEKTNLEICHEICSYLDTILPKKYSYKKLINFVEDRPGHDKRYSIDASKIIEELGWKPIYNFSDGLEFTINWYLKNKEWFNRLQIKSNT